MYILIVDISLIVSKRTSVTIAIKSNHYNISVRLTYLHVTLNHSIHLNIQKILGSCSSLVSNVFYHLCLLLVVRRTLTTIYWRMHLLIVASTIVTVYLAVQVSSTFILSNRFYTQSDWSLAYGNAQYYTDNQRLYWLPISRGLNISCINLCTSDITKWRQYTSPGHAYLSQ